MFRRGEISRPYVYVYVYVYKELGTSGVSMSEPRKTNVARYTYIPPGIARKRAAASPALLLRAIIIIVLYKGGPM